MTPDRRARACLIAAALLLGANVIERDVAARARPSTTTFKGVRPRPSPDHTFRGA